MRPSACTAAITGWAFTMALLFPLAARAAPAQPGTDLPTTAPTSPALAEAAPADAPAPAPSAAPSGVDPARTHFEAGRNAYTAGDYPVAIREFKAAQALRPSPVLSYNIGLANEQLGKRAVALRYYERYLRLDPNAGNRAEVEARMARLRQAMGQTAAPPAPPGNMPPPDPNAMRYGGYAAPPPPPPHYHNDWWIWMVVGGSILVTATIVAVALSVHDSGPAYYYYDRAPRSSGGAPAMGAPLFRF